MKPLRFLPVISLYWSPISPPIHPIPQSQAARCRHSQMNMYGWGHIEGHGTSRWSWYPTGLSTYQCPFVLGLCLMLDLRALLPESPVSLMVGQQSEDVHFFPSPSSTFTHHLTIPMTGLWEATFSLSNTPLVITLALCWERSLSILSERRV